MKYSFQCQLTRITRIKHVVCTMLNVAAVWFIWSKWLGIRYIHCVGRVITNHSESIQVLNKQKRAGLACTKCTPHRQQRWPKCSPLFRPKSFVVCEFGCAAVVLNISVAYTNYDDLIFIINVWFGLSRNPIICYLADESESTATKHMNQRRKIPGIALIAVSCEWICTKLRFVCLSVVKCWEGFHRNQPIHYDIICWWIEFGRLLSY